MCRRKLISKVALFIGVSVVGVAVGVAMEVWLYLCSDKEVRSVVDPRHSGQRSQILYCVITLCSSRRHHHETAGRCDWVWL